MRRREKPKSASSAFCRACFGMVAAVVVAAIYFAAPSFAENANATGKLPAPVIAIIDVQRILQESLSSKSVQKQLDAQRAKFQSEISVEENELRRAEQNLVRERDHLSAQAYSDKEQHLRQRFSAVENHVQERRKVLDQAFTDSMNAVRSALLEVVDVVAHERGANLVVVKQQAFWTDLQLDITDEVLKRLDQKLPKVDVALLTKEKQSKQNKK